jgi:hypothetical protein
LRYGRPEKQKPNSANFSTGSFVALRDDKSQHRMREWIDQKLPNRLRRGFGGAEESEVWFNRHEFMLMTFGGQLAVCVRQLKAFVT